MQQNGYVCVRIFGCLIGLLISGWIGSSDLWALEQAAAYSGSGDCRRCHERFYTLWAPSFHGLAMQPYTDALGHKRLTPQTEPIRVGRFSYQAFVGPGQGYVLETGADREQRFPIAHVLGGKNVFYFLTPWKRGRLQTLPVSYDVRQRVWFDTAASGVRHLAGDRTDQAVHWTDPLYTFNTSCYDCHVSQLDTHYDPNEDAYHTVWAEPGINCETCHGPGRAHVRVCEQAPEGTVPEDLKIISTSAMQPEQINALCGSCHAKMTPITASFRPGDRFFDHFDLVTLEHPDFYADGRDLGENYTYTTWRMSPCLKSGHLDCMHCHTSSGRYRFTDPVQANQACLPCHRERVAHATSHTHHRPDCDGNHCIACHMPVTAFARMRRSDHSMRPPAPAATLEFKSPNACTICHADQNAVWADRIVRQWHVNDYQKSLLETARLVDDARQHRWTRLAAMLAYIQRPDRDEVAAASLIRAMRFATSGRRVPVLIDVLAHDPSPLVRSAAAGTLAGSLDEPVIRALVKATRDAVRLVRIRAAEALGPVPRSSFHGADVQGIERATTELLESWRSRMDDFASHFNAANFWMNRGRIDAAIEAYRTAQTLRPDYLPAYVNMALAYNLDGQNEPARQSLEKALAVDPNASAVHLNLAMLLGEMGQYERAETAFRRVLELDPNAAQAAYNLGILVSERDPDQAIQWSARAAAFSPDVPRYVYTHAFFLAQSGQIQAAVRQLESLLKDHTYTDAVVLLGRLYQQQGHRDKAVDLYVNASRNPGYSQEERRLFDTLAQRLSLSMMRGEPYD